MEAVERDGGEAKASTQNQDAGAGRSDGGEARRSKAERGGVWIFLVGIIGRVLDGWKIIIIFAGEKNGGQIWLLATTQKNAKTAFTQPYFPSVLIVFINCATASAVGLQSVVRRKEDAEARV